VNNDIHPVDFDALERGTWIEVSTIEKAYRVRRGTDEYQRAVLQLRDLIERNTGILSREDKHRIRLMTDSEALRWNWDQHRCAARKMRRAARRTVLVRHDKLSEPDRRLAEFQETVITAQAIRVASELRTTSRALKRGQQATEMKWLAEGKKKT
jgi:hypothetical protein